MDIEEKGGLPWTRNLSPHFRTGIICLLTSALSMQILEECHLLPGQIRAESAKTKFENDHIKGYCEKSLSGRVTLYNYVANNPDGSPIVSAAYTTDASFAADDDLTDARTLHRSLSTVYAINASSYLPKDNAIYYAGTHCLIGSDRDIREGFTENTYYDKQSFFLLFNQYAPPPAIPRAPLLMAEEEIKVRRAIQEADKDLARLGIEVDATP